MMKRKRPRGPVACVWVVSGVKCRHGAHDRIYPSLLTNSRGKRASRSGKNCPGQTAGWQRAETPLCGAPCVYAHVRPSGCIAGSELSAGGSLRTILHVMSLEGHALQGRFGVFMPSCQMQLTGALRLTPLALFRKAMCRTHRAAGGAFVLGPARFSNFQVYQTCHHCHDQDSLFGVLGKDCPL